MIQKFYEDKKPDPRGDMCCGALMGRSDEVIRSGEKNQDKRILNLILCIEITGGQFVLTLLSLRGLMIFPVWSSGITPQGIKRVYTPLKKTLHPTSSA